MKLYLLIDESDNVTSALFDPYPGAIETVVDDDYNTSKAIFSRLVDGQLIYDATIETAKKQAMTQ